MSPETHLYDKLDRPGRPPRVDVHSAAGSRSVIVVHGGGFIGGHRRMGAVVGLIQHLLAANITVVAPDYRMPGRGGDFPTAVDDMEQAWNWWTTNAHRWSCDPNETSLIGISAGAALAGCMEVQPERLVLIYGPHDLTRLPVLPRVIRRVLFHNRPSGSAQQWSPLHRCTHLCPTLLIHGLQDRLVHPDHSRSLFRARTQQSLPTVLIEEPDLGHGWLHWHQTAAAHRTGQQVTDFLTQITRS